MSVIDTNNGGMPAEASPPAAAPAVGTTPAAPPAQGQPGSTDIIDSELPDQPLFDAGYVRSVRSEAQRYRQELRDTQAKMQSYGVFDAYEPDDRQVWIDLATMWQTDPNQAAQVMARISSSVLGDGNGDDPAVMESSPPSPEPSTGDLALTPERVEELIAAKLGEVEAKRSADAAVAAVYQEVRNSGYDPDTKEGFMVLWLANNETDGNLAAAVERMKAWEQGIVDKYVAGKSSPMAGVAPSQGSVATSAETTSGSWKDTANAAQQFLEGQMGSS